MPTGRLFTAATIVSAAYGTSVRHDARVASSSSPFLRPAMPRRVVVSRWATVTTPAAESARHNLAATPDVLHDLVDFVIVERDHGIEDREDRGIMRARGRETPQRRAAPLRRPAHARQDVVQRFAARGTRQERARPDVELRNA